MPEPKDKLDKSDYPNYQQGKGVRGGLDEDFRKMVVPQVNNCIQGAKFYASKEPPDVKRFDRNIDAAQKTLKRKRQDVEDEIGDRDPGM